MRIDAAPDGAPYVLVTLSLAKDMSEGNQPSNPTTPNIMGCLLYTSHAAAEG